MNRAGELSWPERVGLLPPLEGQGVIVRTMCGLLGLTGLLIGVVSWLLLLPHLDLEKLTTDFGHSQPVAKLFMRVGGGLIAAYISAIAGMRIGVAIGRALGSLLGFIVIFAVLYVEWHMRGIFWKFLKDACFQVMNSHGT